MEHQETSQNKDGRDTALAGVTGSESFCRWNFDADENGLFVCRGQHEKQDACHVERLHPAEALRIINELRAEVLWWRAWSATIPNAGGETRRTNP